MSRKRRLVKTIKNSLTQISRKSISAIKRKLVWLLRTLFVTKRRRSSANAGFVLPTVTMVSIVAVLLTTAIFVRSYDRAQNASNVRVNSAVLSAATPAIDRGRAKLNKLFQDRRLPRSTPTDDSLYSVLTEKLPDYTFGDETPLELDVYFNENNVVQTITTPEEKPKTAWKFPVDTDNNGKFDSYTLYGIFFRTPPVNSDNQYERARNTLEARTPPMAPGNLDPKCGGNTSATLIGNTGWVKQKTDLKKSFFVYTATVPITDPKDDKTIEPGDEDKYEPYKGNRSFAALEYQQDRVQTPPNNLAVVYEDDLALTPGPTFRLNGAIFTNSNFLNSGVNGGQIRLYQVSANDSCFYEARNATITVGGNVALAGFTDSSHSTSKAPQIDLFQGKNLPVNTTVWKNSVTNSPRDLAYNNLAYEDRIEKLVKLQMLESVASDPSEVEDGIVKRKKELGLSSFTPEESNNIRRQQLEIYFKRRTRRVPYTEVPFGESDGSPTPLLQGSGNTLRPNDKWIYPTDPDDGKSGASYTKLSLYISGESLEPKATEPKALKKNGGKEAELGDRVLVGNNLPELWWDKKKARFVSSYLEDTQEISGVTWNNPSDAETRTRRTTVQTLADVGSTKRDGEWELDAAKTPDPITEPVGGLRVVTGAGIYLNAGGTPSSFVNTLTKIWPDTKPVPGTEPAKTTMKPYWMYAYLDPTSSIDSLEYTWDVIKDDPTTPENEEDTPYLQMRATAVYHYKQGSTPIACVSSYYVPTNSTTAKNISTFAGKTIPGGVGDGLSNNGIVYGPPTGTASTYKTVLDYQAELTYPNGRSIDDGLLKRALAKTAANRTLSEQSAIDAQICALQILNGTISPTDTVIPHGAIREITLLDAKQVKQNSITGTSQTYDMPIRDRQPLEIRATVLDLGVLTKKTIGGGSPTQEYLLPTSGLIYATRDDALPDDSASTPEKSPVDYILDPTRRPNAIMLVNGKELGHRDTNDYRETEKGLILATNLPAYIKGDFNLHTQEEFSESLADNWSNFYSRSTLNPNFACRTGDPKLPDCTTGDKWRPATVLADAVTLLSGNFNEGFRDQGDYDWSQKPITSVPDGFSRYNNFVTQANWSDDTGKPKDFSSYLNNFVTPIGMRTIPGAYLTEVCPVEDIVDGKGTVDGVEVVVAEHCKDPLNWTIKTSCGKGEGNSFYNGKVLGKNGHPKNSRLKTGYVFEDPESFSGIEEGEKKKGPNCFDANAPRRLAFLRDDAGNIDIGSGLRALAASDTPNGKVGAFDFADPGDDILTLPGENLSIPWLKLTIDTGGKITAMEPVLQLRQPFATTATPDNTETVTSGKNRNWLQEASDTTFNLIVAAGDIPARSNGGSSEDNGGLHNFVRFIEHWNPSSVQAKAKISGSLMQVKKSAYATGPFTTAFSDGTKNELKYAIEINNGRGTGYIPPNRQWGYDVALLSQSPDLFAQKLVLTPPDVPDEYFREVGRNDKWVETLICAKNATGAGYAIPDPDQRPSICKS